MANLRITEIFYSLQGEAKTVGLPTAFVRLTGCPLRCRYCDTAYAFSAGEIQSLKSILDKVATYSPRFVTVTGGEPLAQAACLQLLSALCDDGYTVSLETSGAIDVTGVDPRVSIVLDLKTPASGEVDKNLWNNLSLLKFKDQIKFVICDRQDFDWAVSRIEEYALADQVGELLFSASHGQLAPVQLADWILSENLPVRLQMQMHKHLWGDKQGV